jgi:AcrR family transcriptional regulator
MLSSMGRPREHGAQTRAALLTAAAVIVGLEGAAAVTVRRVAQDAGTSTRAVYSLFGDKNGLLRALFHQAAEIMRRHHEDVPVMDDPVEEIRALARAYRAAAKEQPNLYALFLGQAAPGLHPDPADLELAFGSRNRPLAALKRCADAGRLGGHDPEQVVIQVWALLHGLTSLELQSCLGPPGDADARWDGAVESVLVGYGMTA